MISMLSYKPLSQLIIENKDILTTQLVGKDIHGDVDCIKQSCIEYIHSLTQKDSEYMNQLSLLEQDMVSPAISMFRNLPIRSVLDNLSNNTLPPHTGTNEISVKNTPNNNLFIGYIVAGICGAIVALFIAGTSLLSVAVGITTGALIVLLIGYVCIKKLKIQSKSANGINDSILGNPHRISVDDVNCIINSLSNSAKSIDGILNTYRSHIEQLIKEHKQFLDKNTLDNNFKDVIETLQYVLGNMSCVTGTDEALIKDTMRRISSSLMHHGYKVIHYSEEVKALFQVEIRQISTIDEFKPAIVKVVEGKEYLVCKGAVVLPNN